MTKSLLFPSTSQKLMLGCSSVNSVLKYQCLFQKGKKHNELLLLFLYIFTPLNAYQHLFIHINIPNEKEQTVQRGSQMENVVPKWPQELLHSRYKGKIRNTVTILLKNSTVWAPPGASVKLNLGRTFSPTGEQFIQIIFQNIFNCQEWVDWSTLHQPRMETPVASAVVCCNERLKCPIWWQNIKQVRGRHLITEGWHLSQKEVKRLKIT